MEVVLTRDYKCAPEGHTTIKFKEGETLTGRAAEMAVADGAAKKPKKSTPKPKVTKPAEPDHEG